MNKAVLNKIDRIIQESERDPGATPQELARIKAAYAAHLKQQEDLKTPEMGHGNPDSDGLTPAPHLSPAEILNDLAN